MWCCLESMDGRPNLEQIRPVIKAGKPVFVDKPVAASLRMSLRLTSLPREPCALVQFLGVSLLRTAWWTLRMRKWARFAAPFHMGPANLSRIIPIFSGTAFIPRKRFTPSWDRVVNRSFAPPPRNTDVVTGIWSDGRVGTLHRPAQCQHAQGDCVRQQRHRGTKGRRRLRAVGPPDHEFFPDGCRAGAESRRRWRSMRSWKRRTRASAKAAKPLK